jgi:hypothetical protein
MPNMNVVMGNWVLRVEVDGEWEQCSFPTQEEALSAFAALTKDYEVALKKAVLVDIGRAVMAPGAPALRAPEKKYLQ